MIPTPNFWVFRICNFHTKGHGTRRIKKSDRALVIPSACVVGTRSIHFEPGGGSVAVVTGMHRNRKARKKLIVHAMVYATNPQQSIENLFPTKIRRYKNNILHLASPRVKTWNVRKRNCICSPVSVVQVDWTGELAHVVESLAWKLRSSTGEPLGMRPQSSISSTFVDF